MKTIVVLGMHRSATSLVARTLHNEVFMGTHLLKGLKDNPKGHYENVKIIALNDKILKDAGGNWLNPPLEERILEAGEKYQSEIIDIINTEVAVARNRNLESWGFKDPRTCLTIKCWHKHLPCPQYVVCYRNPLDIAKSLKDRNNFSIEKGIELTREYNKRIFDFINNDFIVYDYDPSDLI